jgi:hypothetical protein
MTPCENGPKRNGQKQQNNAANNLHPNRLPPNRLRLAYRPLSDAALNHHHPLATLSLYVSDSRRPPSSSPSGDQCAARPGLIGFYKSNERMPAAVPAGFFIVLPLAPGQGQKHLA